MVSPKQKPENSLSRLRQQRSFEPELIQRAEVRYKTQILNPDGSVASERPWKKNLILDQGLDQMGGGALSWASVFTFAAVGTGTNPTSRASGAITFTQATTVLTASAAFFVSQDVGRLFKYGTGTAGVEMYITGFTSSTVVSVGVSQTVGSATVGTIWYVNDTALQTESARTNLYSTLAGDCQTTLSGLTATHKRTFLFPAVGGTVTYNEIGWASSATVGANLFGRDVIIPGDTLIIGQQYKVIVTLAVTYSPAAPVASGNVGTGLDTTGTLMLENFTLRGGTGGNSASGNTQATIATSGGASSVCVLDLAAAGAGVSCRFAAITATYSQLGSASSGLGPACTNLAGQVTSLGSYTNGTFTRVMNCATYPVNSYNGNVFGLGILLENLSFLVLDVKFTTPQPMTNSQTFTFSFRFSWQRILTN